MRLAGFSIDNVHPYWDQTPLIINLAPPLKPIFHLATLFARREAKTRIRQRDWLKLAEEKIRREQVGSVPAFLSVGTNKVAKWKIGLKALAHTLVDQLLEQTRNLTQIQQFAYVSLKVYKSTVYSDHSSCLFSVLVILLVLTM